MQDVPLQENKRITIGIDLMGSDTAPEDLYRAALQLQEEGLEADIFFFASEEVQGELDPTLSIVASPDVITMDDDPLQAVRRKKESSLCQGIDYLHKKKIDAFVSAGNTGALLIAAKTTLKPLPGIDRPALLALLPTKKEPVAVLDVGANVTLKPEHIFQFATMGIAYQKSRGIESPTVGLLNIGAEAQKGTPQLREAYTKLETMNRDSMVFVGNVEGKRVFQGDIDVVVTDGFTGNVFLKTAEGVAAFILEQLPEPTNLRHRLNPTDYPGAILCGVDGIVVKCHGDTSPVAFMNSIKVALRLVQHQFLEKINQNLSI
jgi:glycerol-3-phosphate acyltransferase PlsX